MGAGKGYVENIFLRCENTCMQRGGEAGKNTRLSFSTPTLLGSYLLGSVLFEPTTSFVLDQKNT